VVVVVVVVLRGVGMDGRMGLPVSAPCYRDQRCHFCGSDFMVGVGGSPTVWYLRLRGWT
jgi:hypothetical protein